MDFQQVDRGPAARARARTRPADGDRLPHRQGLALRDRGPGLPRRRPQALLGGLLPGARGADRQRRRAPAHAASPASGAARPAGDGRRHGGVLLGGARRRARAARGSPASWSTAWRGGSWRRAARLDGRSGARGPSAPRRRGRLRASRARRRGAIPDGAAPRRRAASPRCAASWAARSSYLNQASAGALLVAAADLLGSTSVNTAAAGFPPGFWNARHNPRLAAALGRRHLRGRHRRRALGHLEPSAATSAWAPPTAPSWRRSATSPRACTASAPRRAGPSPAIPTGR